VDSKHLPFVIFHKLKLMGHTTQTHTVNSAKTCSTLLLILKLSPECWLRKKSSTVSLISYYLLGNDVSQTVLLGNAERPRL